MARTVRGQAAMEFVMTYGWAILAVIVAVAALAYFGVLAPKSVAESCMVKTGFGCDEYSVKSSESATQLRLVLDNSMGQSITVNSATADIAGTQVSCVSSTANVDAGGSFQLVCDAPTPVESGSVKVHFQVKYVKEDGAYEQALDGDITTKVERGTVVRSQCIPNCDGTTCGSDGCLGTCTCAQGLVCIPATGACETVVIGPEKCVPNTCADIGVECGSGYDDGCVGTIDCGPDSMQCASTFGTCVVFGTSRCDGGSYDVCDAADPRVATCEGRCGISDGCGGECADCDAPYTCDMVKGNPTFGTCVMVSECVYDADCSNGDICAYQDGVGYCTAPCDPHLSNTCPVGTACVGGHCLKSSCTTSAECNVPEGYCDNSHGCQLGCLGAYGLDCGIPCWNRGYCDETTGRCKCYE